MMLLVAYRWLVALFMLVLSPLLANQFLLTNTGFNLIDESVALKKQFPFYHSVTARVYSINGRLDYRLMAHQLNMKDNGSFDLIQPDIDFVTDGIIKGRRDQVSHDLRIRAELAHCSSDRLDFFHNVDVIQKQLPSDANLDSRTRFVRAQQLSYQVNKHYFEARDHVYYCFGMQEVFADKAHGFIGDEDYVFDNGKIIFNKRSKC